MLLGRVLEIQPEQANQARQPLRLWRFAAHQLVEQGGGFGVQAQQPGPLRVVQPRQRGEGHADTQQLRQPACEHPSQRGQARARQGQRHLHARGQRLGAGRGQVQQVAVARRAAGGVGPILSRVVIVEHRQLRGAQRHFGLGQHAAQGTKARAVAQGVQRGAVAGQHPPVLQADALRAKQQFSGAGLQRIALGVQHLAQQGLHDQVDEQRGQGDGGVAKQAQVIGLQRAGGQQAVAQRQPPAVVLGHVGVSQCGQLSLGHGAQRVGAQRLVQGGLGRA